MATRRSSRLLRGGWLLGRAPQSFADRLQLFLHPFVRREEQRVVVAELFGICITLAVAGLCLVVVLWPWSIPSASTGIAPIRRYTSPNDYRINYPLGWSYYVQEDPGIILPPDILEEVTFRGNGTTIVVRTARHVSTATLVPAAPLKLTLNGSAALWYHDYDPETGLPLDRVIIHRPDGNFNELRGYGPVFNTFIQGFSLTSKSQPAINAP